MISPCFLLESSPEFNKGYEKYYKAFQCLLAADFFFFNLVLAVMLD